MHLHHMISNISTINPPEWPSSISSTCPVIGIPNIEQLIQCARNYLCVCCHVRMQWTLPSPDDVPIHPLACWSLHSRYELCGPKHQILHVSHMEKMQQISHQMNVPEELTLSPQSLYSIFRQNSLMSQTPHMTHHLRMQQTVLNYILWPHAPPLLPLHSIYALSCPQHHKSHMSHLGGVAGLKFRVLSV